MEKRKTIRIWILAVLLAILGTAWYIQYSRYTPYVRYLLGLKWTPETEEFRRDAPAPKKKELVTLESVQAQYRLGPDRRFLLAASDLHHLLTGQPKIQPQIRFQQGYWQILFDGSDIGKVSELPDYLELRDALVAWARELLRHYPLRESAINLQAIEHSIQDMNGIAALAEMDRVWNTSGPNRTVLPMAARAAVLIRLQSLDYLAVADRIPARAIALLSLNLAIDPKSLPSEDCLLASLLGYTSYAQTAASYLPETDPVKHFVQRNDSKLQTMAVRDGSPPLTRYLNLLRLAELGSEKEFERSKAVLFPKPERLQLALLKAASLVSEFSWEVPIGYSLSLEALKEVSGKEEPIVPDSSMDVKTSAMIESFQNELDRRSSKLPGPFLDRDLFVDYYEGHFYSGLYAVGNFYRNSLSSVESTRDFANELGEHKNSLAADFQKWYSHLATAKEGKAKIRDLMADLEQLRELGGPAFLEIINEIFPLIPYQNSDLMLCVKKLVKRIDSRPEVRGPYAWIVHNRLDDLKLAERLYRSLSETSLLSQPYYAMNYAKFTGNRTMMKRLMHNRNITMQDRAQLLFDFATENGSVAQEVKIEYESLVAEDPDTYRLRRRYVDYLEKEKRYKDAQAVILDWLRTHDSSEGFPYIFACAGLSDMYLQDGQYQKAWESVEPVVDSWQGYAMSRAVLALDRIGRTEEAIELGRAAAKRYQDSPDQLQELLQVLWRNGRYQEAADELRSYPYKLSDTTWCWTIAPAFAEVFTTAPSDEAVKALDSLLQLPNRNSGCYAERIAEKGNSAMALRLWIHLNDKNKASLTDLISTYPYLKEEKGALEAISWIREQLPAKKYDQFAQMAIYYREFELVWGVIEDPAEASHPNLVWLSRSAACAIPNVCSPSQKEALVKFLHSKKAEDLFQKAASKHGSIILARYLAGLASLEEVRAEMKDNQAMCNAAFYVGLKAETEARYDEASDWYRVAVETDLNGEFGYSAAYETLESWRATGKKLSYLQAKQFGIKKEKSVSRVGY